MAEIPAGAHWVRFNRFFGDAMMIHGAIARLRAGGLPLVAWGPGWVLDLFEGCGDYSACVGDPVRKFSPWEASRMLRAHRPASLIAFPKSARPHVAAWLAGVPIRLGCGDGGVRLLTTHQVMFYRQDSPFVERYQGVVAEAFPHLAEPAFWPFRPRARALEEASRRRDSMGLRDYVVFAPGANSSSKRLSIASFQALGRRLMDEGLGVVILGGAGDDQVLAAEIRADLPSAVDLTGKCGLALSAAWICGARVLVGMDSGLAHVSAGAGIPTLSVFGPTRPRHSAPWGPRVSVLRREDLRCLECMEGACPLADHPCMTQVSERALWGALKALLQ